MKSNKIISIFYDTSIFRLQNIGGISIVFGELINRMKRIDALKVFFIGNDQITNNIIFPKIKDDMTFLHEPNIPKAVLPFTPLLVKLPDGSIYHSTYNRYSFQKNITKVITIHDLGYEKKIMQSGIKRAVHLFFKKMAIKNADAIICVSDNTREDLMHYYGDIVKNKVVKVIYNGVDEAFFEEKENTSSNANKSILYVGGRQPYKNFKSVVLAVKELKDTELIIAGGGSLSEADSVFLAQNIEGRYRVEKNLSTAALVKLYQSSFCLVYPSSYEGFGLPLLEAMAAGCAVIACNNSCIKEISGDAAILIENAQVELMVANIELLRNEETRLDLIHKGKIQAAKFTWEKTVQETLFLYKSLKN